MHFNDLKMGKDAHMPRGILDWRFSVTETAGLISIAVAVVLWSVNTFQTKLDADRQKQETVERMESLEDEVQTMRSGVDQIGRDVSYIRGFLEPAKKK